MTAGRTALTLALAVLGGGLFQAAGLPAALLTGAMVAVAGAALAGLPLHLPNPLSTAAFIMLGLTMGTGVTPDTLHRMATWPLSMVLLAASMVGCLVLCSLWLERVHGWDRATARFAAIPGALGPVLVLAAESRADLMRVALAQSLRLFTLVAVMPRVLEALAAAPAGGVPAVADAGSEPLELVLVGAACTATAAVFHRLRAPGGVMMGAMLASAVLYGSGIASHRLPDWLLTVSFVVTGAVIGVRFRGVTPRALLGALRPSLESVGLALALTAAFAAAGSALLGLPFGQLWLAYAPGGVEAMTIVAFALGLDVAFVATHHVVRFAGLGLLTPWWQPAAAPPSPPPPPPPQGAGEPP
ncbi:AbrB family transcriptional regulator [Azospirillum halopraeferens]|uniref:AbrB family transcriptional regulator n=1 Tax=Azospirillum halopraeferens TaxID=34010 RepID=UPI000421A24A|nr:AbrB family transcriptional regulator [Azospirillum halopraeferens]